ncbi:MAG: alpha/beta hydrolase [Cyanobacteriota bacterium]|nr:alpha/beta hydrolase [Cyanobacteriota bacterium]
MAASLSSASSAPLASGLGLPDGTHLHLHSWMAPQPLGRILMLHGKGDYGGRFQELATLLQSRRWSSYAPDMRGFGRSPGSRCGVNRFADYLADLEFIQSALTPHFWLGYSTGANWVVEYALRHPQQVQGLILISPAFRIDNNFTPLTRRLLSVADRFLPQTIVARRYNPAKVTALPERQRQLAEDPYVTGLTRARFVAELERSGDFCLTAATRLSLPILLLYTPSDSVVNPAGSQAFAEKLSALSVPLTVKTYPGSRHDLLHDQEAPAVQQAILDWIQNQPLPT